MSAASCSASLRLRWYSAEQLLRLLAQPAGLLELVADLVGALVERLGDHARHLDVDDDAEEDDEGDGAQNVASMMRSYRATDFDGGRDLRLVDLAADQLLDDGRGGLLGDRADFLHGRRP